MDEKWVKTRENWDNLKSWVDQPENRWKVLLISVATVALSTFLVEILMAQSWMSWLASLIRKSNFLGDIFFPATAPPWKDKLTALIPVIGLPTAFWLWHWRDRNVRDQIVEKRNEVSNQREQIENQGRQIENQSQEIAIQREQVEGLKAQIEVQKQQADGMNAQIENDVRKILFSEFQNIQRQAAGLFDLDGPDSAKMQLQISALHQLRPFLSQDNPENYRRAAFELLLAGHAAAMDRIGVGEWDDSLSLSRNVSNWRDKMNAVDKERLGIISADSRIIFSGHFPLENRKFDFVDVNQNLTFLKLDMSNSRFIGAYLPEATFDHCTLLWSEFTDAYLANSNFVDTRMTFADFRSASLRGVAFQDTDAGYLKLQEANLQGAEFHGAKLFEPYHNEKTNFDGAQFDLATAFIFPWDEISEDEKSEHREEMKRLGMTQVS
ncbi:pentapeptide repeat-containing protein [Aurantiacibacter sp. D1-12]|uniref:pentapeptide repeat-containing protein n=1 Tax=Aurantiacibacter sp. D1-12 TaxID=2993658 RepID=UPI00237CA668|nr:pentapeptide repeat-containing protein [Aurantiacibacter sp. D1-12]MDE1467814.1 pentapeptide repeat-containing protein [Aurantiacibacter sp. D1-12]